MAPKRERAPFLRPRKILGVSLAPEVATAIKTEAARRDIAVKTLVLEMWDAYKSKNKLK